MAATVMIGECHHCGERAAEVDSFNFGEPVCRACHDADDIPFGEAATIEWQEHHEAEVERLAERVHLRSFISAEALSSLRAEVRFVLPDLEPEQVESVIDKALALATATPVVDLFTVAQVASSAVSSIATTMNAYPSSPEGLGGRYNGWQVLADDEAAS